MRPPPFDLQSPFSLAPMCDFVRLGRYIAQVGAPELFHIEYVRVHEHTAWDKDWLSFIEEYGTKCRIIAQLIGREPEYFKKGAEFLQKLPVSGVDLNLGCPAPKIYKQNVGGGLLRELETVERILAALREAVAPPLTLSVKLRLGFREPDAWQGVLQLLDKYQVDFCTVHLRTVADGYHAPVRFELARQIVAAAPCPVILNGDIQTASQGFTLVKETGAWGVSVGRAAIRYPWIFAKAAALREGRAFKASTFADAYDYFCWIVKNCASIGPMKGYLNFLGLSVDPNGIFLKCMREARTPDELLQLGKDWFLPRADEVFPEAPHERLYARPSMEKPKADHPNARAAEGYEDEG